MHNSAVKRGWIVVAGVALVALLAVVPAYAVAGAPTPLQVTNTTGGQNQNSSIDASGNDIVFTSNSNDAGQSTFDQQALGNGFTPPGASHPNPICVNCNNTDTNGELYLWHKKATKNAPANSFFQITTSTGGGLAANEFPDINQKGTFVVWDSDRDLVGNNADGNREIFLYDIVKNQITQITNTTGGGDAANRNASISDDGTKVTFDSSRDFSSANCSMPDGSPCDNSDNNSEVMIYNTKTQQFTQVTDTTGGSTSANVRSRISSDGGFLTFQSTRDFSSQTCTLADGVSPCDNTTANAEIMRYDIKNNSFIQVTDTSGCGGTGANERSEISKNGAYITFQSTCEAQINPTGCGSCDGNDEAFIYDFKAHRVVQLTITDGGFNRVPRIAGAGSYIVFESNRNLKNLNASHDRILYVLKRNTSPGKGGKSGPGQLIDDPGLTGVTQNSAAKIVTINFEGGFNTSVEQFGISSNGKYISFDNGHGGVGRQNQEIWFLDRTK